MSQQYNSDRGIGGGGSSGGGPSWQQSQGQAAQLHPSAPHQSLQPEMANGTRSASHQAGTPRIASLRIGPLDLGFLPTASASQTSLLDAVVGPNQPAQQSTTPSSLSRVTPPKARTPTDENAVSGDFVEQRRKSSEGSRSYGTSTEREWDVLSDASLKLNEGEVDEEAVQELEKKVNKRRSNLPHLESQLAELEAQIKAAEERLARAQAGGDGQATRQTA